ncbi:hypothetical protein [Trinickia mobilis]|nr:hypothetical protein [Trinickia mobilis]
MVIRAMWGHRAPSVKDAFDLLANQMDAPLDRRLLDRILLGKP